MYKNYCNPPKILMNEKELANYLGQTEYAVKQLRLKCGLPTLPKNGRHEVQYYWPVVDEFFRQLSKPFNTNEVRLEKSEYEAVTKTNNVLQGTPDPATSKQALYKPMEPV